MVPDSGPVAYSTPLRMTQDAVLDLFESELGDVFTSWARDGWGQLLTYVGGALIWVRVPWPETGRIARQRLDNYW